jgi:hypothetical protein
MKRTPLRKVSVQRAKELREYSKLRKIYLEAHPYCQVWLLEMGIKYEGSPLEAPLSHDIHHRQGRQRSKLNDTSMWLAVCRDSHHKIHNNPRWAYEHGYLIKK